MPDTNVPEEVDPPSEHASGYTEAHKNAWNETLEDMWTLEQRLQDDGWETIETAAGHTELATLNKDSDTPRIVHIVPDSDGEAIQTAFEEGDFPTYDVYRTKVEDWIFSVIVLLDPETEQAILISAEFELREKRHLIEQTHKTGDLYTVIKFLNGEMVGTLRHEKPEKFFPDYDSYTNESS